MDFKTKNKYKKCSKHFEEARKNKNYDEGIDREYHA